MSIDPTADSPDRVAVLREDDVVRALEQEGAVVVELDGINREPGFRIEDGVPMAEWPETIRQAEVQIEESSALVLEASWSTEKQVELVTAAP